MKYSEQLKTKEWKIRRLKRIMVAQGMCEMCGHTNFNHLQVHHKKYIEGKMAWEYEDEDLMVLCRYCHKTAHAPMLNRRKLDKFHIKSIFNKMFNNG